MLLTNKNIYHALEYTDKLRNEGRKMGKDKEQTKKDKDKGVEKHKDNGLDKEQGSVMEHDQDQVKYDDHDGSDKIIDKEDHCKAENNENNDAVCGADDMPNTDSNGGSRGGKGHHNKDHDRVLRAVVDKRLTLLAQVMVDD